VAVLAALGAIIVGLIALYLWLAMQMGSLAALGIIGGSLLVLTIVLFALALAGRRPSLAARPRYKSLNPRHFSGRWGRAATKKSSGFTNGRWGRRLLGCSWPAGCNRPTRLRACWASLVARVTRTEGTVSSA
jgi:hypothetical protein